MEETYRPVPVAAAKTIAEQYGKSIVIIFAHDPVHGLMHTTTYGTDPQNKAWAAQGGEIATKALGGLREAGTDFEDYRLQQARKLLAALKDAVAWAYESDITDEPDTWLSRARTAVKDAEKFIDGTDYESARRD